MLAAAILLVVAMVQPPVLVRAEAATNGASWECLYLVSTGGHYVVAQNVGSIDACWEAATVWLTSLSSPNCSRIVTGHSYVPGSISTGYQGIEIFVAHDFTYKWSCNSEVGSFRFGARLVLDSVVKNCYVKLSNDASPPASGDLAEVEPRLETTTLRAKVYDSNGQLAPNANVKLEVTVDANSGGHGHTDSNRPKGLLSGNGQAGIEIFGNTGSDGLPFTFTAPAPAGDHKITASCTDPGRTCTQEGPDKVWVGVKDLFPLSSSGPAYTSIEPNADVYHPDNHYLTVNAYVVLVDIATAWRTLYKPLGPLLHLNDASLVRGGAFDIDRRWGGGTRPKHAEHRRGTVIDIRANNAPGAIAEGDFLDFIDHITKRRPTNAAIHCDKDANGQCIVSTRHFHVRLFGRSE